jgi:hypothetical protein
VAGGDPRAALRTGRPSRSATTSSVTRSSPRTWPWSTVWSIWYWAVASPAPRQGADTPTPPRLPLTRRPPWR